MCVVGTLPAPDNGHFHNIHCSSLQCMLGIKLSCVDVPFKKQTKNISYIEILTINRCYKSCREKLRKLKSVTFFSIVI